MAFKSCVLAVRVKVTERPWKIFLVECYVASMSKESLPSCWELHPGFHYWWKINASVSSLEGCFSLHAVFIFYSKRGSWKGRRLCDLWFKNRLIQFLRGTFFLMHDFAAWSYCSSVRCYYTYLLCVLRLWLRISLVRLEDISLNLSCSHTHTHTWPQSHSWKDGVLMCQ